MLLSRIWNFLKEAKVFLVVLSFGVTEGLFVNLVSWLPYYYIQINEESYSLVSILGCACCFFIGGIVVEYLLFEIFGLEKYSKRISYFLLILTSAGYCLLWTQRNSQPKLQIILICISNFLLACPYNRISTVELIEEAQE